MTFTTDEKIFILFGIASVISCIANLVKLTGMSFDPITGMAVARAIGVFVPPVGVILGVF